MNIVTRGGWGARDALPTRRMKLPATQMVLHHTDSRVTTDPAADMRAVEKTGVERFGQFSYSYCVHPDGTILEGCGTRVGAHTAKMNSTTFGVALLGNYDTRPMKLGQVDAVRWLVAQLIAQGLLRPGTYPTGGHRDVAATACPGTRAYQLMDALRVPWAPERRTEPAPVVGPRPVHDTEENTMRTTLLPVALDAGGNGWADWDPGFGRDPIIVGAVLHGPSPPDDHPPYWDGQKTINVAAQPRDGKVRVVARGGIPGDTAQVWVTCA